MSRLLEELYRIAGYPELADRLRPPSHRSKSFRAEEESPAPTPEETASDADEAAEPEAAEAEDAEPATEEEDATS